MGRKRLLLWPLLAVLLTLEVGVGSRAAGDQAVLTSRPPTRRYDADEGVGLDHAQGNAAQDRFQV